MPAQQSASAYPEIYRTLQARIDRLSVPFPRTESGVELRLLAALFSEDEAAIALELSAAPEPIEVIARRVPTVPFRQLGRILVGLSKKGAINSGVTRVGKKRVATFGLAPLVVGMFEFQVDRLTKEYVEDFHQYLDEGFRDSIVGSETPQLRTVPVRAELTGGRSVAPYEDIRAHIAAHPGPFSVINCVCRQAADVMGETCTTSSSHETCLMVGSVVPHGRQIDHDEILSILDRAEREGHVLQPQNARDPAFICCCCRDCCEVLQNARKLPRPADAMPAPFFARVQTNQCTGCRTCLKRCPMDAITMDGKLAVVDEGRCIGCGLCASACPETAIVLDPRPRRRKTPKNTTWLHLRMFTNRRGVLSLIPIAVRKLFGKKI
jgi:ferredoxin